MYGTDPFSAQHATGDNVPSIFGALPYPRSASVDPPLDTRFTFRFAVTPSSAPSVLDCTVLGPNNETVYRVTSVAASASSFVTVLKAVRQDGQLHTVAHVEWPSHSPTVEIRGVCAKHPVRQWLRLSSDRRSRYMIHGGIQYSWAPVDRFIQLFAPGSSEWLARVTKQYDTVVLELTLRAIELGLIDIAVLATVLLQSGRNID